ncbi:hypothetical protein QL285_013796 [Trifolium repens]|nr:hypothetical protein QL285_013796 [Trifolium repens]
MVSNRHENGLQQTVEWSPDFDYKLITVGIKDFSDISTAPHIRDHKKNGLQAHLKDKFEWTVLPISQQLFPHSQLSYLKFKYQKNFFIYK